MLDAHNMARLLSLHSRLKAATFHEIKKDGHHKSSEAAMSISLCLPNAFKKADEIEWCVEAYSYLLCPDARSETWFGKTPAEAISKAEDAINKWLFEAEMEMAGFAQTPSGEGQSVEDCEPF